ncbi:diacylglycerol/polyprenol kinase family protein [Methanococcus aeolicus]|uniref:Phosphatidate cytidylyltransferase n=1 Tax=Methanococcus aeolicus (strain ATCC BAA-1280 / DSM 17508 / OCM 812 / Nankai-3) TaxID=419665 RepID=A6UV24_META3|nr:hypothetical protein [Methanococcus aeolicus]ABR56346.1 phosphatidate cytidylyltransferase [Methanococcus aeolicus Nankai-3]UXM84349.1 hypothetical protein N6C89_06255 [Methanococcus aeolicus]
MKELYRQLIHLIFGLIIAFAVLCFGKIIIYPLFIILFIGIFLYFYLKNNYLIIISELHEICSRNNENGRGAILFIIGLLIMLIIIPDIKIIFYSILVLAVGDSLATIVGINGKLKIKYFKKTVEGFLAFFISSSLILYYGFGTVGIVMAFIGAFMELISEKIKIDDNLLLPVGIAIMLELIKH